VLEWAQTINTLITHELISRVGGAGGQEQPDAPATPSSLAAVVGYIEELVEERTRRPGDDIVSRLVRSAAPEDGKLSQQELIAMVVMLLMTGIDTVGGALANVVTALDRNRAAWRRVVADPSLAASAYAEGIRLLPPTPMATRIADADIELGNVTIPAGSTVILMYGAANLDPAVFTDPTVFDLDRNEANSLAFGHGAHYCLGASLAMLQGEIVLQTLARHCPDFTVVGGPARRRAELAFHSFAELDLRLSAKPRRPAPAEV
jgi:cytochrome P450